MVLSLDDSGAGKDAAFEAAWSQFLYATNLMQFVPESLCVTQKGCAAGRYNELSPVAQPGSGTGAMTGTVAQDQLQVAWNELIEAELFDDAAKVLARRLRDADCPLPSGTGIELDGEVAAELIWEARMIAVQLPEQYGLRAQLEAQGWRVLPSDAGNLTALLKEDA